MSAVLYDEAFLNKLKGWTNDTELNVFGVDDTKKLFQVIATKQDDKPIKLPILALTRMGGYKLLNFNRKPLTFDGLKIGLDKESGTTLNAVPINIEYQLDIYTRYYDEADEYVRNLIFNIINYPVLEVDLPYMDFHYKHCGVIRLSSDVEDNSNIPQRIVTGQFTRLTLYITIDDAYLWDIKKRYTKTINNIYVKTNDE